MDESHIGHLCRFRLKFSRSRIASADTVIERRSSRKPPYRRGMPGTAEDHLSLDSTTSVYKDWRCLRLEGVKSATSRCRGGSKGPHPVIAATGFRKTPLYFRG